MEPLNSKKLEDRISFTAEEEQILKYWKEIDAFQTSLKLSEGKPEYSFYDGPPFATGLPHYGHILAGTIKDIVTRYAHQTGHHVARRFGWDTHGLPVEYAVDKILGIKSSADVDKMGIAAYNKECRGIVLKYCKEWETIVTRMGRWIDFEHGYRTYEPWYMESEWYVFQQLYKKGLIYKGFRVMPYSTACTTPLSNFEAGLNYKDVPDPAIVITFPMVENPEVSFLAWTTTPWTLPSNLALCTHPDFDYVLIKDIKTEKKYILAECRLSQLYPKMLKPNYKNKDDYELIEKMKGKDLKGKKYIPLFTYFKDWPNAFQVINDTYVTNDSGTGIVHCAPGFGEDDYRVCMENGIIVKGGKVVCPLDKDGCFNNEVPEYKGQHVKQCDEAIMKRLKDEGRLLQKGTIVHSYPYCWRSDTPLIYRAIDSWFVNVVSIKERLLDNNMKTYWVPAFVKEKRFHNWLKDARDWNISRNRYWGTPIPIWTSDDGEEIIVPGSIKELEELTGKTITDLHRESIDDLIIPSKMGKGDLHRIPEVFDCWFESGSMPYAQCHYPFENKERFEAGFPADFVAEGLDQTRGWFYTLMILSTALFDKPAFKNLIVNGLVLAKDGKKMSKSLNNYPPVEDTINNFGADALRLYLINSPVVRAECLKFNEDFLSGVVKDVLLPWYNAFRFLFQCLEKVEQDSGVTFVPSKETAIKSENVMDRWLLASLCDLIQFVRKEMEEYRLYTVVPKLLSFINSLTNVYIRLNRNRLKGIEGLDHCMLSLCVLYETLLNLSLLMAPFTPFIAEYFYQKLRLYLPDRDNESLPIDSLGRSPSIHYLMLPNSDEYISCADDKIRQSIEHLVTVIELGRSAREKRNISLKMPVASIRVVTSDEAYLEDVKSLEGYLKEELNTREIIFDKDEEKWCKLSVEPDNKLLGKRLGKTFKDVKMELLKLPHDEVMKYIKDNKITVCGQEIVENELHVMREFMGDKEKYESAVADDGSVLVMIDVTVDKDLIERNIGREFVNRVQKMRKSAGLNFTDKINIYYEISEDKDNIVECLKDQKETITSSLQSFPSPVSELKGKLISSEDTTINDTNLKITITWAE